MNYVQAVEYIESLGIFGIKAGLERIEYLLEQLGQPQNKIKCIHVAGTNGKGSVCTMLESMLSGYKTGKFTSPHLVSYNERFAFNGQQIDNQAFADLVSKLKPIVEQLPADLRPTQFELLTAMAFEYFAAEQVDYAIIEVGLGGLLDSTNVIKPLISVITNVDMDHMDKCGDTLSEIAQHKAGIIKAGVPVVTAAQGEALTVIKACAQHLGSKCLVYGEEFAVQPLADKGNIAQQEFLYTAAGLKLSVGINLLGEHQLVNAAVAIAVVAELFAAEQLVALTAKLANARWAGRLEIVATKPTVILDGAHNLAGAQVLRNTLDKEFAGRKLCFILGMMQDKDIRGIVDILIKESDMVIPVLADPEYPRSATVAQIAQFIKPEQILAGQEHVLNHTQALQLAREFVGEDGVVCIAGSLYLIGRVKAEGTC